MTYTHHTDLYIWITICIIGMALMLSALRYKAKDARRPITMIDCAHIWRAK